MEKEEIIKYLRLYSNSLKDIRIKNNSNKENNKIMMNSNHFEKYDYAVIIDSVLILINVSDLIKYINKPDYGLALFSLFTVVLIVFLMHKTLEENGIKSIKETNIYNCILDLFYREKASKEKIKKDNDSYDNDVILNNIETAVEFLQGLTNEEQAKYLKLKI